MPEILKTNLIYFVNEKYFEHLSHYIYYKLIIVKKLKNETNAIIMNTYNSNKEVIKKFQLLDELKTTLGLINGEEYKQVTSANHNEKIVISDEFIKNISKAFDYRGKPFEKNRINLTIFYMAKMKSLLGCCIVAKNNNKKIRITENNTTIIKKFSMSVWNDKVLSLFDSIYNMPKNYEKYGKDSGEYMFVDNIAYNI